MNDRNYRPAKCCLTCIQFLTDGQCVLHDFITEKWFVCNDWLSDLPEILKIEPFE